MLPTPPHLCTVLVVDDDDAIRALTAAMLGELGLEAVVAPDGPSALATLASGAARIDCVLLDFSMRSAGRSLLSEILRARREARVVLMSGWSAAEAASTAAGLVAGFLQKPFTLDELGETLARILAT